MALPRIVETKIEDYCFDTPILLLGKVGENLATKVIIDASEWQDGSGDFQLLVKRADGEMFTATITASDGVVTWLIPVAEISAAGYGEIELNYVVDEAKIKSARVDTRVFSSIEIDSLPPNGTTWSQLVLAAINDARAAAEEAEKTQSKIEDALADTVSEVTETAEQASNSATTASQQATAAGEAKDDAVIARNEAVAARDEIFDVLNNATILDTTETVTFNSDNLVDTIVHVNNVTELVVRTDVFTYNGNIITEVRTAADGSTQTNIYNLNTLEQQFNV